jgi:hypothetical protein
MGENVSTVRSRILWLLVILASTALLLVGLGVWCFLFDQDLTVTQTSRGTFIDVQFLGEYQANARRLRLIDLEAERVVWEMRARDAFFPLWLVPLQPGANPAVPEGLSVRNVEVLVPHDESFDLIAGRKYRVELWSYKEHLPRHVSEDFTLAKRPGA